MNLRVKYKNAYKRVPEASVFGTIEGGGQWKRNLCKIRIKTKKDLNIVIRSAVPGLKVEQKYIYIYRKLLPNTTKQMKAAITISETDKTK